MAARNVPKPPDQRARRNRDPVPTTKIRFVRAKQPSLPAKQPDGSAWPARTRAWWSRWGKDPRSDRFDAAAWDELLDTAVIHARVWSGEWKAASELRLRTARFGTTPEDRARLRVALDDGLEAPVADGSKSDDEGEEDPKDKRAAGRARGRYQGLRVVDASGA